MLAPVLRQRRGGVAVRRREDGSGQDVFRNVHPSFDAAHGRLQHDPIPLRQSEPLRRLGVQADETPVRELRDGLGKVGQRLLPVPQLLALREDQRKVVGAVLAQRAALGIVPLGEAPEEGIHRLHLAGRREQFPFREHAARPFLVLQ